MFAKCVTCLTVYVVQPNVNKFHFIIVKTLAFSPALLRSTYLAHKKLFFCNQLSLGMVTITTNYTKSQSRPVHSCFIF